ncbi:O-methyltransferase [Sinobaca sp. H24]|uniref:O-methyltransferase n=1 Tax=Sinobaca sp. H24 TaxID=2923376 RepID=UPI00207AEB81|nr:O-methyltransferase [Sinobaca sp. H24]
MKQVNDYIQSVFQSNDDELTEVLKSIRENNMPEISVSPNVGKILTMLVKISRSKNILEIGALGGYSGICLARGFGKEGHLTSLEVNEDFAQVSKQNHIRAGFEGQTTIMVGEALDTLKHLRESENSYDFIFIDADKKNYVNYLDYAIELANPQALIVADNVLAGDTVFNADLEDKRYTEAIRQFNEKVASHPQLESTLIPSGDGITVSRVVKNENRE